MKVNATFHHVLAVTREVEVDENEFRQWAHDRYGEQYDTDLALACWIDALDAVVRSALGNVYERWFGEKEHSNWAKAGSDEFYDSETVRLPATVLFTPEGSAE